MIDQDFDLMLLMMMMSLMMVTTTTTITNDDNREPKQRRRQRDRQKSNRVRLAKQQLCTSITLFVAVVARQQRESA